MSKKKTNLAQPTSDVMVKSAKFTMSPTPFRLTNVMGKKVFSLITDERNDVNNELESWKATDTISFKKLTVNLETWLENEDRFYKDQRVAVNITNPFVNKVFKLATRTDKRILGVNVTSGNCSYLVLIHAGRNHETGHSKKGKNAPTHAMYQHFENIVNRADFVEFTKKLGEQYPC